MAQFLSPLRTCTFRLLRDHRLERLVYPLVPMLLSRSAEPSASFSCFRNHQIASVQPLQVRRLFAPFPLLCSEPSTLGFSILFFDNQRHSALPVQARIWLLYLSNYCYVVPQLDEVDSLSTCCRGARCMWSHHSESFRWSLPSTSTLPYISQFKLCSAPVFRSHRRMLGVHGMRSHPHRTP